LIKDTLRLVHIAINNAKRTFCGDSIREFAALSQWVCLHVNRRYCKSIFKRL